MVATGNPPAVSGKIRIFGAGKFSKGNTVSVANISHRRDLVNEPMPIDVIAGGPLSASYHKDLFDGAQGETANPATDIRLDLYQLGDGPVNVQQALEDGIHFEQFQSFAFRKGCIVGHPIRKGAG